MTQDAETARLEALAKASLEEAKRLEKPDYIWEAANGRAGFPRVVAIAQLAIGAPATIRSLSARLAAAEAREAGLREVVKEMLALDAIQAELQRVERYGRDPGQEAYDDFETRAHRCHEAARAALQSGAHDTANGETK